MAEKTVLVNGRIIRLRADAKTYLVNGRIVKNQDAPVGGATGKSNPLYGCLGGPLAGPIG